MCTAWLDLYGLFCVCLLVGWLGWLVERLFGKLAYSSFVAISCKVGVEVLVVVFFVALFWVVAIVVDAGCWWWRWCLLLLACLPSPLLVLLNLLLVAHLYICMSACCWSLLT